MHQKLLYLFTLLVSLFLVITALGGGLFGQAEPWILQWQHTFFSNLCHQQPGRSFWLDGQPMAVCSRCLGIYSGFFVGLLTGPILGKFLSKSFFKKALLVTVILNIVDVAGNMLGIWSNTLISRVSFGFLLAISAGLLLGHAFVIEQNNINTDKNYYGATRSA